MHICALKELLVAVTVRARFLKQNRSDGGTKSAVRVLYKIPSKDLLKLIRGFSSLNHAGIFQSYSLVQNPVAVSLLNYSGGKVHKKGILY